MRPWTEEEDAILTRLYPDYIRALGCLQGRTYYALRNRARGLGLTRERHRWTVAELKTLARLWKAGAYGPEIRRAFPDIPYATVRTRARQMGLGRRYRRQGVGDPLYDAIAAAVDRQRLTFRQLDALAGTGQAFYRAHATTAQMVAAAEALGLIVEIEWE